MNKSNKPKPEKPERGRFSYVYKLLRTVPIVGRRTVPIVGRRTVPIVGIVIIWTLLWLNFIARDFYKDGLFETYVKLATASYDEKHAITYGKKFYEFLKFAEKNLPRDARYDLAGPEQGSIDARRGVYYLYPRVKTKEADYILVFEVPDYDRRAFSPFKALDESRYILKRR